MASTGRAAGAAAGGAAVLGVGTACGVLAGWSALMVAAYAKERARARRLKAAARGGGSQAESKETAAPDRSLALRERRRWVDHPFCGWICENGAVALMAVVSLRIRGNLNHRRASWHEKVRVNLVQLAVRERLQLFLHWLLVHKIYSHIPYFHPEDHSPTKTPSSSTQSGNPIDGVPPAHGNTRTAVVEWLRTSAVSHVMLAFLFAFVLNRKPQKLVGPFSIRRFAAEINPLGLCAKLAVVRVVVDVCFAAGHWIIHRPGLFHSGWLRHKTHHEHNHPSVLTNQHFTVPDLFVEAYLPVIIGMVTLRYGVGWACNPLEEALVSGYIGWQEQCSHSGKPVPFSTMLPPLQLVYNHALGLEWDRRNVEFHQVHHERMRCNYSITQWVDHLLGTTRWA